MYLVILPVDMCIWQFGRVAEPGKVAGRVHVVVCLALSTRPDYVNLSCHDCKSILWVGRWGCGGGAGMHWQPLNTL